MASNDIAYYRKRLSEEQALEAGATSSEVRSVHHKLAELYEERLAALHADGAVLVQMRAPT